MMMMTTTTIRTPDNQEQPPREGRSSNSQQLQQNYHHPQRKHGWRSRSRGVVLLLVILIVGHNLWESVSKTTTTMTSTSTSTAAASSSSSSSQAWELFVVGVGGEEETKTPTTTTLTTNNDDTATKSSAEDAALVNVVGASSPTTSATVVENEAQQGVKQGSTVKNNRTTFSAHTATTQQEQEQSTPMVVLSACLLLKDDNDILDEWIAYHYHLWNLRHLVVAVDPSSQTSPTLLLEPWNKTTTLLDRLTVQLWVDQDYMPADFLQGDYSRVPQRQGQLLTKLQHVNTTTTTIPRNTTITRTALTVDLQGISNHRYRQREFYRQCIKYFHTHQHQHHEHHNTSTVSWIVHIDTDEYLALNPWKLENEEEVVFRPTAGSMMQVLESQTRPACFAIPRLLFGSREEPNITKTTIQQQQHQPSSHDDKKDHQPNTDTISSFESLRWKYHASYEDTTRNGHPKALLDWRIWKGEAWKGRRNKLLQKVYSIHRPLAKTKICPKDVSFVGTTTDIAIHHYLGSLQRYLSREDPRRSQELYNAKQANLTYGPLKTPLDGWLDEFIRAHGRDKVAQVLPMILD